MPKPETIDVSKELNILKKLMEEHRFKITPQRIKLAEWMFKVHEHFTIDDIIESFKSKGERVSIATAYRMIQMMQDLGLLLKHDFGKGQSYYEHTPGHPHHDHIICNDCGSIVEFCEEELENLKREIAYKHNFNMIFHSLHIYGDCLKKNCSNKKKK